MNYFAIGIESRSLIAIFKVNLSDYFELEIGLRFAAIDKYRFRIKIDILYGITVYFTVFSSKLSCFSMIAAIFMRAA